MRFLWFYCHRLKSHHQHIIWQQICDVHVYVTFQTFAYLSFFSEPSTRFCTHVLTEYFMCSCLSEGVLFLQHRKQCCMSYSLNAGGERERCIRPRCSEQANDQSHRLEQNQSIQIRTHPLPRVRNDPFSKSSCILHLILSVCYDTFIRALNTGYVKMLLSNLKIILRG